jgi:hypothetical protein
MRGLVKVNDGHVGSIGLLLVASIFACVICTPARSVEATDALLVAAIDYLHDHIAMEILSRSACGEQIREEQLGSRRFGTRVFLEEASEYLSPEEVEQLNHWLLSGEYKEMLLAATRGVYEIIGVKSTDPSRCAYAVDRYGSSFSQSKDDFRSLGQASLVCGAEGACDSQSSPQGSSPGDAANEENSN